MERPNPKTIAWYEAAIPADPRAVRGQMFAHPCSFVNRNMFYGTFAQSVVLRVGEARAAKLTASGTGRIFEPMEGRAWKEYVQIDVGEVPTSTLAKLARDALEHAATLPPKAEKKAGKKPPAQKSASPKTPVPKKKVSVAKKPTTKKRA